MQLKSRLKATKAEIADMKSEQARVREELAISLEELQRELKLRLLNNDVIVFITMVIVGQS